LLWGIGWLWAVIGLFVGAMFTTYGVTFLPPTLQQYQDIIVTVGAVLGGFLVQFFGFLILLALPKRGNNARLARLLLGAAFLLCAMVGLGVYWFLTRLGVERGLVGHGFVFGLITKLALLLLLPLIKNLLWGIPIGLGLRALGLRRKQVIERIDDDTPKSAT
jgi:hypothetical protein